MKPQKTTCYPYHMLVYAVIGMAIAAYDCYMIYAVTSCGVRLLSTAAITVAYSPYGRILGVPIGYFGLVFYLIMFALAALLGLRPVVARCAPGGALLHRSRRVRFNRLMYLDLAFIRAFCIYCLISAILTVLLLLSAIVHFRIFSGGHGTATNRVGEIT